MPIARHAASKVNSTINITPMVDVMLVLLIIFMVITPMLHPGPDVQLPAANNAKEMHDADSDDALLVAVNKEGVIFLGNEKINPSSLMPTIHDRIANRVDKTVFFKADARLRYRTVADVVDEIQAAGASQLGLLTERRRP